MSKTRLIVSASAAALCAVAALSLSACNKPATEATPPADTAMPAEAEAPTAEALPAAPPAPVEKVASSTTVYEYADDAADMADALGDAPPDYAFDYGGVRPFVWRTANDFLRVVENTASGPRSYYYRPGASDPFLVREGSYSYGYDRGRLVAVYDGNGKLADLNGRADLAGRLLARARDLHGAAQREPHRDVPAPTWTRRQGEVATDRSRLDDQRKQPDWQAYRKAHPDKDRNWSAERQRRQDQGGRPGAGMPNPNPAPSPTPPSQPTDHGPRPGAGGPGKDGPGAGGPGSGPGDRPQGRDRDGHGRTGQQPAQSEKPADHRNDHRNDQGHDRRGDKDRDQNRPGDK